MSTDRIREQLEALKAEREKLLGHRLTTESMKQCWELDKKILVLERELKSLAGEEYAAEWEWPVTGGYLGEMVISQGWRTYLIYPFAKPVVIDREKVAVIPQKYAVVVFPHCVSVRHGDPNDEVIAGHPLYGSGIDAGGAYLVQNSRWLKELEANNAVHRQYDPEYWRGLKHYLLFFKDHTFECVARDVHGEAIDGDKESVLREVLSRI